MLADASGLLDGLCDRLDPAGIARLELALSQLQVIWSGRTVRRPGEELLRSLCLESFDRNAFRAQYQERLAQLLAAFGTTPPSGCCGYHRSLFHSCAAHIDAPDASWLSAILEVLACFAPELEFQYSSAIDLTDNTNATLKLSRFMRLETFIQNHSTQRTTAGVAQRFRERLSPALSSAARRSVHQSGELGIWHGRIGSYPSFIGCGARYKVWCEAIKPFATLTEDIEKHFDRSAAPDRLLQRLGVPFAAGQYWIELIYPARGAGYYREDDRSMRLAIPTHLESAGNWAFVPDRDTEERFNHARDLRDGSRGLKEIVHQIIDASALEDTIVWGKPTQYDWAHPNSPFVEEPTK